MLEKRILPEISLKGFGFNKGVYLLALSTLSIIQECKG